MLFLSLLLIFVVSTNANFTPRCPPNTIQSKFDNKVCYLFVNDSRSFDDAEHFCNGNGGNLVVIPSQFVNAHISAQAFEKFEQFTYYWVGGTIKTTKMDATTVINVWGWTKDNELMTFSDWDPTATRNGNCTGVQSNSWWSAIDCNRKNPFVCQIPAEISYCDDGWAYFNFTNSCYRKFSNSKTILQSAAENSCIEKGGHLASIHTVEENQFITDLTSIGSKVTRVASIFWIGGQRNDNSDQWYWTDNTTFNYSNWGYGYGYNNYFCSTFYPDFIPEFPNSPSQWNAENCHANICFGYLCKKSPNNASIN